MERQFQFKPTLLTVAIVLAMTAVNYALNHFLKIDSPMLSFCFGITVAGYLGGFRQGLLATVLSLASVLFFFAGQSFIAAQQMWAVRCLIFFLNGVVISYACGRLRGSREHLRASEVRLREERRKEAVRSFEELRASRGFLDSIIENLPNMVFVKDAKTLRFVRFNRAGEDMLGRSRDELIGKNDFDFFPADQAQAFIDADRRVLSGRTVVDIAEEPIQNKSGETLYLHTKKIPVFGPDGNPEFLLGISEDITEAKKQAQQKIELIQARAARPKPNAFRPACKNSPMPQAKPAVPRARSWRISATKSARLSVRCSASPNSRSKTRISRPITCKSSARSRETAASS
jgi:PAS domain S-box-containing protein